jgi:Uma2 family endonuclease
MTRLASKPPRQRQPRVELNDVQHFVLDGVTWDLYEHFLKQPGATHIRTTYDNGTIEMMAPLAEHEVPRSFIAWMIKTLASLAGMPFKSLGSSTFRRRDKEKGLEPDDCYFFQSRSKMRGVKRWDARRHPPPELAVEVDIFSRSIAREPIYAALGVPEFWRYDGKLLQCFHLTQDHYSVAKYSRVFPFLEVSLLSPFVNRVQRGDDDAKVHREFVAWVKKNGWASEQD